MNLSLKILEADGELHYKAMPQILNLMIIIIIV